MKKQLFYSMLLAGALAGFTSCSSDKLDNGEDIVSNDEGQISYLAVNIQDAPSASTRVDGYENGDASTEGKINSVRFYFFDSNGNPFPLANTTNNVNYLTWQGDITDNIAQTTLNSDPTTVESRTNVVLVIQSERGGGAPAYVMAVVNPDALHETSTETYPNGVLGNGSLSISQLSSATRERQSTQYATAVSGSTSLNNFVMSSSVYANLATNRFYRAVEITTNNVRSTKEAALANPAVIYVERLAAKVKAGKDTESHSDNWTKIDGKDAYILGKYSVDSTTGELTEATDGTYQIAARIDGWNLADEAPFGNLIKNINGSGTWASTLGFTPWSSADYHRSFWELSVDWTGSSKINHSWNNATKALDSDIAYTMPNTPTTPDTYLNTDRSSSYTDRTKVLLATTLMYSSDNGTSWNEASVSSYAGTDYLTSDNVKDALLSGLIRTAAQGSNPAVYELYKEDPDNSGQYIPLTRSDIEFSDVYQDSHANTPKDYDVVPILAGYYSSTGTVNDESVYNNLYYELNDAGTGYTRLDYSDAMVKLHRLGVHYATVRNNGKAYYYTSIRHLGASESYLGYYGVVRNHYYKVNVSLLKGFGTAVYNPDKEIIPITPSDEDTYLAARIDVLQWRVVEYSVAIDGSTKPATTTNP